MAALGRPTMLWSNLCISICPALHIGLVVMTEMQGFSAMARRILLKGLSPKSQSFFSEGFTQSSVEADFDFSRACQQFAHSEDV